jgi:ketosteroid isomerase-like protein
VSDAAANKQLLQHIFDELSRGNSRPFVEAMADDVVWTVMGRTPWSGSYHGKAKVLRDLLGQLGARLADRYKASAQRIIAEGPYVVVQAQGEAVTKAGAPYNNEYCFIYRVEDGVIKEVTEYLDTELVTAALGAC